MNKTGLNIGTKFEYFDDLFFGLKTATFFEKIEMIKTQKVEIKIFP